ncbi:TonB-dependent receptor plug domain-containing protein [Sphingomonas sp. SRS2]|uniref:TonB-dependent receptor plug domain-containing protein n=1 Tax=Sphingomonas sp. SRS2 TaxID=133190 RepID=UPI000698CFB2|nr:TonB-dependent receptor plug domain-containing protein [Sphingomonas sp. SRS2]
MSEYVKWGVALGSLIIATAQYPAALAQTDPVPQATADEQAIVVTARRREESLSTVPVSIVALQGARLAESNVQVLSDVTNLAPGIRFTSEGDPGNTNITLRGLGNLPLGTGVPAVVNYFSEVPLPAVGVDLPILDLQSVQVLKGPQGTLFGRNTIGGAILLTPTKPTYEFEGYVQGTLGNYDYRALEGAINIPIVQDRVALRVAAQIRRRDGLTENLNGPRDFDNIHQEMIRGTLLLQPTERLTNTTTVNYFKANENSGGSVLTAYIPASLGPLEPIFGSQLAGYLAAQQQVGIHKVFSATPFSHSNRRTLIFVNRTSLDLSDDVTVNNIFGYVKTRYDIAGNNDGLGPLVGPFPFTVFRPTLVSDRKYITEELQLQGSSLGSVAKIGGSQR